MLTEELLGPIWSISVDIPVYTQLKRTEGLQVKAKQSLLIANNAIHILDYIRRKVASGSREIIIPICSVLVRLCLDILSSLDPQFQRDVEKLGSINWDSEGPGAYSLWEKVVGAGLVLWWRETTRQHNSSLHLFQRELQRWWAKLSSSPSHPQAVETMRRGWKESSVRQLLKTGHLGARATAGRMRLPSLLSFPGINSQRSQFKSRVKCFHWASEVVITPPCNTGCSRNTSAVQGCF